MARVVPIQLGRARCRVDICLAVLVAAVVGKLLLEHSTIPTAGSAVSSPERGAEPDPTLTPGATRRVAISEVCSMAHEEVVWKYQRRCVKRFFRSMES